MGAYRASLGVSQRIFYFHVPLGWLVMLSIVVVAFASISHLIALPTMKVGQPGHATAELGLVVCLTLILVTGSIWTKPIWGVWVFQGTAYSGAV